MIKHNEGQFPLCLTTIAFPFEYTFEMVIWWMIHFIHGVFDDGTFYSTFEKKEFISKLLCFQNVQSPKLGLFPVFVCFSF